MTTSTWITEDVRVAGTPVRVRRGGAGAPVVVLHHEIGSPERLPFDDELAAGGLVYRPTRPGYDGSARPDWLRNVRDLAVLYQWLLAEQGLEGVTLVGLGFGGWVAAEMATMSPRAFRRLVLVGAMGIKPRAGEILDQALLSYLDYVRAGFADPTMLETVFGADLPTEVLEHWDLNREMTFRIAWKPYLYNPGLPHLLGGVRTPALVVWGSHDRIVPAECGDAYARALPHARLTRIDGAGHFVEMEKPRELARAIAQFAAGS
ncbi:MAG: alpha/beta fold hydrolase [Candidatus Rokuibacteriota bacterium]